MGVKKGKRKGLAVVSPKWQWLWWLVAGFGVRHWSWVCGWQGGGPAPSTTVWVSLGGDETPLSLVVNAVEVMASTLESCTFESPFVGQLCSFPGAQWGTCPQSPHSPPVNSGRWCQDALCGQSHGLLSVLCLFAAIEHVSDPVNWTRT